MQSLNFQPIGFLRQAPHDHRDLPRQPEKNPHLTLNSYIELKLPDFPQALEGLEGFSHLWLIFAFHNNHEWNPMVLPPRLDRKMGVLATRAPYRPNPLGLSCVRLIRIEKNKVWISSHDLIEGTPILDIKPYIAEYDSHPDASRGWLDELEGLEYSISATPLFLQKHQALLNTSPINLLAIATQQLQYHPFDRKRKRVTEIGPKQFILAYQHWRVIFQQTGERSLELLDLKLTP